MRDLIPWTEAVGPVRERFCEPIDAACRWHADRGVEADPKLFAVIHGALLPYDDDASTHDMSPMVWTRAAVRPFLWARIPNWCTWNNATTWPLEVVPALWQWFDFLHHTGRLDPRSDPLWELRKPLICYGGLDFDGRFRPEDDPSPIPCECHLPYRQSADYLNERVEAGMRSGRVLFDDGADDGSLEGDPAMVETIWTDQRGGSAPTRGQGRVLRRGGPRSRRRDVPR